MNWAVELAAAASCIEALVGVVCLAMARARGWGHMRWFALVAFAASVYSGVNTVYAIDGVSESAVLRASAISMTAASLCCVSWILYSHRFLETDLGAPAKAIVAVLAGAIPLVWIPGLAVDGTVVLELEQWGVRYRTPAPTWLGDVLFGVYSVALLFVFAILLRGVRGGTFGARTHVVGYSILLVCAIEELLVGLGWFRLPYLGDVGYLASVLSIVGSVVTRTVRDAERLQDLNQELTGRVEERTRELRQSEEWFRSIIQHSHDGFVVIGADRNVKYVSPSSLEILGYAPESLVGKSANSLLVDSDHVALAVGTGERAVLNPGVPQAPVEVRARHADGSLRWLEIIYTSVAHDPAVAGLILNIRDITERKEAELALREREEQLRQAEKLEAIGTLAAGIAHDFNNLLVGILGNSELALSRLPEDSPAREHIQDALRAAERAGDATHQLLAYTGKGRFQKESIDLSALVVETVRLLRGSISERARLKCECARDLPPIEGDPAQIGQVVLNLIVNASDALGDEPGEVSVRTERARTGLDGEVSSGEKERVSLVVTDSGCGMDAKTRQKIFDPFFTTKFSGRGLGLAAMQGIVRSHQGSVEVESEPGRGTTFRVHFPAAEVSARAEHKAVQEGSNTTRGSGTILVADDEAVVRALAEKALTGNGFEVLTAQNGEEAVSVFREHAETIGLVLLDLTMPRMNGAEALVELRRIRPDVPVVLISGFSEANVASQLTDERVRFLQKPFGPRALVETVVSLQQGG